MAYPPVRLLIGLGNYPSQYAAHRHNIGATYTHRLVQSHGGILKQVGRLPAEAARLQIGEQQILAGRLRCYMNESGRPARALMDYFNVAAEETALIFDEIDLEPGRVKIMCAGSSSTHNGVIDARKHLGDAPYLIRIGVGRPAHSSMVKSYVLQPPKPAESAMIEDAFARLDQVLPLLCGGDLDTARDLLHKPVSPAS